MEVDLLVERGPMNRNAYRIPILLERAQQLASALPEDRRKNVLQKIEFYRHLNGMAHLMDPDGMMDPFAHFFDESDDDVDEQGFDYEEPRRRRRKSR